MRYFELFEGYKEAQTEFQSVADPETAKETISKFRNLVDRNQVSGDDKNIDIWRKRGWDEFSRFVNSAAEIRSKTQVKRKKAPGKSITIRDNEWFIVVPIDKEASCFHGKQSDWCTTKPNQTYFEDYTGRGIILIYCIRQSDKKMWAIAYDSTHASAFGEYNTEQFTQEDTPISLYTFQDQTGLEVKDIVDLTLSNAEIKPIFELKEKVKELANSSDNRINRDEKLEQELMKYNMEVEFNTYISRLSTTTIAEFTDPKLRLFAIRSSARVFSSLTNPTEPEKIEAVKSDAKQIRNIPNPSHAVQQAMLDSKDDLSRDALSDMAMHGQFGSDILPAIQVKLINADQENIRYIPKIAPEAMKLIRSYYPDYEKLIQDTNKKLMALIDDRQGQLEYEQERIKPFNDIIARITEALNGGENPVDSVDSLKEMLEEKKKAVVPILSHIKDLTAEIEMYKKELAGSKGQ